MIRPPFSPEDFTRSDPGSKLLMSLWFEIQGKNRLIVDTYQFAPIDCRVETPDGELVEYLELERRDNHWKSGKFPFPDVHVPVKKGEYFKAIDCKGRFISISGFFSDIIVAPMQSIVESPVKESWNKRMNGVEKFHSVPTEQFTHHQVPAKVLKAFQDKFYVFS